ncbi:piggyBac transposable element-derived protein 1-like isoform X2 [Aedes aegypti]|uniref:PiggyBac transposable element-derived protein domain-containing protein n=1 Tax=Aedes aegypti TaxID=7159 RepID=A0A6I8U1W1_AEDAE|nr:piggyBac transposable element-derived protein 1-like isoform X2 [Aedes aegypti]
MRSKPGKYGMKVWCLSCVDCDYVCNLQVYTGKKDKQSEKGQGKRIVNDLIEPFIFTGREVTTDNFFTSTELAEELWEKNIMLTGTVRHNKKELPPEFVASKGRMPGSILIGYREPCVLTSYIDGKKKKPVIILTINNNVTTTDQDNKPNVVLHYNATKGAVDSGDFVTRKTNCVRKTKVWTKKLAMELISIACLNSSCLFRLKYPEFHRGDKRWRSLFLQELCDELIYNNVNDRLLCQSTSAALRNDLQRFSGRHLRTYVTIKCTYCTSSVLDNNRCHICASRACSDHLDEITVYVCYSCSKKKTINISFTKPSIKRLRCQRCSMDRKTQRRCCNISVTNVQWREN